MRGATPAADRLPHILVLLDRWEGLTATLGEAGGALTDVITRILSEGASAGIHLIMTGDRSLLAGRTAALCEDKLVFKLAERDDYALAGLRPRDLPTDIPPGRAFAAGTGTETQVALLAPDPSARPRPPPCTRSPTGRRPRMPPCPARGARSGSTSCLRGSASPKPGSSAHQESSHRCGA